MPVRKTTKLKKENAKTFQHGNVKKVSLSLSLFSTNVCCISEIRAVQKRANLVVLENLQQVDLYAESWDDSSGNSKVFLANSRLVLD